MLCRHCALEDELTQRANCCIGAALGKRSKSCPNGGRDPLRRSLPWRVYRCFVLLSGRANLGQTPDRKLLLGALHSEWILEDIYRIALISTLDLIPIAVVTNNPTYREERILDTQNSGHDKVQTGSAPVYGAGLTPFGLKVALPPVKNARLFLAGAVGCLWFTRDMPVPDSRRFNLAFEYGGGIQVQTESQACHSCWIQVPSFVECIHGSQKSWVRWECLLHWAVAPPVSCLTRVEADVRSSEARFARVLYDSFAA